MTYQDRLIEMTGGQRFLLLSVALAVIVLVTGWVVGSNLENQTYISRDSFESGLAALVSTFLLACLLLPFLGPIAYIPVSSYVKQLSGSGVGWAITVGGLILSVYLGLAFACIYFFYTWFDHEHYGISFSYLAFLLLVTLLWWLDVKRLFPRMFVLWFIMYLIFLVILAKPFWLIVPRFYGIDIASEEVANECLAGRFGISLAAGEDGALYVGTIYGIYMTTDKGASWRFISGDWSHKDSNTHALAINGATIYARTRKGLIMSTDKGSHWQKMAGTVTPEGSDSLAVGTDGILYAGMKDGLYKSLDSGEHWIPASKTKVLADSIAVAPDGTLYVLIRQGILKSVDNGANWVETSSPKIIASDIVVAQIAVSQNGALYAGWYDNGIFKSTDQGMTWVSRRDANISIREFAVAPDGELYALTGEYLYQSIDDGVTWTVVNPIKFISWQCSKSRR